MEPCRSQPAHDAAPRLRRRAAVTDVIAAQELHDVGEVDDRGGRHRRRLAAAVLRPGQPSRCLRRRPPRRLRRGRRRPRGRRGPPRLPRPRLGTALAGWMQDKAREKGERSVHAGARRLGRRPAARVARLPGPLDQLGAPELPEGATVPERQLPEGYAVRAATEASTRPAGRSRRTPSSSGPSASATVLRGLAGRQVVGRPGFEPWNLRVVTDPTGDVVGMAHPPVRAGGGLHRPARHRKDHRGRGLAQALLVDSFRVGRRTARSAWSFDRLPHRRARPLREGRDAVTSNWVNRAIRGLPDRGLDRAHDRRDRRPPRGRGEAEAARRVDRGQRPERNPRTSRRPR